MPQIHQNGVEFNSHLAKDKLIATNEITKIPLNFFFSFISGTMFINRMNKSIYIYIYIYIHIYITLLAHLGQLLYIYIYIYIYINKEMK